MSNLQTLKRRLDDAIHDMANAENMIVNSVWEDNEHKRDNIINDGCDQLAKARQEFIVCSQMLARLEDHMVKSTLV